MSERRENSVLFSLKELRRIEDDRVKREEDEAKAKAEAERAAKEAAVRRAREEEEQRRRAEEDRLRRIEEDKENQLREEQLRMQEAERRQRVEGELRLQEERMRLEMQSRKTNSPIKAVVSVAAVLVLIAGGLGYRMYSQHQAEWPRSTREGARGSRREGVAARVRAEAGRDPKGHGEKARAVQKDEERSSHPRRSRRAQRRRVKKSPSARTRAPGACRYRHSQPTTYKKVEKKARHRRSARRHQVLEPGRPLASSFQLCAPRESSTARDRRLASEPQRRQRRQQLGERAPARARSRRGGGAKVASSM